MPDATEARLPFDMGTVDLTSMSAVFVLVSMFLGFMLFHAADDVGATLWDKASNFVGSQIGVDPQTGGDSGVPGV